MPTLEWIGKEKVINHHMDVPYRVLNRVYSYDLNGQHSEDNGSENKIIHGDNLEALKSLLPEYVGRIKCIYIDPPYNTGNENWIYNDNVNDPKIKKWLGEVVGKEGEDLSRHDKWLCMMYPRLQLLHKLLADDGAIFISIDDNEVAQLKMVCDEIFGSRNFKSQIIRNTGTPTGQGNTIIASEIDYILVYAKSSLTSFIGLPVRCVRIQFLRRAIESPIPAFVLSWMMLSRQLKKRIELVGKILPQMKRIPWRMFHQR